MEMDNPYQAKKFVRQDKPKETSSDKVKGPTKFQDGTYIPTANASPREWICPAHKSKTSGGKCKVMNVDVGASYWDNSQLSKKYLYVSHNHMGKTPWPRLSGWGTRETRRLRERLEVPSKVIVFDLLMKVGVIDD